MRRYKFFILFLILLITIFFAGCVGEDGKTGKTGKTGKDGKDGKDGLNGLGTFEINYTFTSDSGTPANVINLGNSSVGLFDFFIPKGDKGDNGINGTSGINGTNGTSGINGINGTTPIKGVDYFDGAKGDKGDKGDTGDTGTCDLSNVYPVGAIYTTTISTNPNTVFGFGTWDSFGSGKVLIGLDSGDTSFDTVEETGGSKTIASAGTNQALTFTGTKSYTVVAHTHDFTFNRGTTDGAFTVFDSSSASVGSSTIATQGVKLNGSVSYTPEGTINTPTYTGSATSVVQPYIVVYFWKRTA